jgi:lipoprotein NlpD
MDMHKKFTVFVIKSLIFALFFSLLGCTTPRHGRVPVRDIWRQNLKGTTSYVVQPGDTLYSIAWAYGLDYRQVAVANDINPPGYRIEVGKKLILTANNTGARNLQTIAAPIATPKPIKAATTSQQQIAPVAVTQPIKPVRLTTTQQPVTTTATAASDTAQQQMTSAPIRAQFVAVQTAQRDGVAWGWPAQGKLICMFSASNLDKGIDVAGKNGAPVLAAASGKVVYASNGLRGYGLLIIIKHNDEYLSAYAHNQKLLVVEGQTVRVGQVIAKMGSTEARRVMLHFEIRKAGKPVDPLQYLPGR